MNQMTPSPPGHRVRNATTILHLCQSIGNKSLNHWAYNKIIIHIGQRFLFRVFFCCCATCPYCTARPDISLVQADGVEWRIITASCSASTKRCSVLCQRRPTLAQHRAALCTVRDAIHSFTRTDVRIRKNSPSVLRLVSPGEGISSSFSVSSEIVFNNV